jgi:ComF family protein
MLHNPRQRCLACAAHPLPLQQVRAAVLYTEPITPIIHKMKYNGMFALAQPLAHLMVAAWPRWQTPVDWVVPIPLHPEREKKRGYNQSALLARHFCQAVGLSPAPTLLRRVRHTQPQVELNGVERRTNVAGAFLANDNANLSGATILLVDDVYTTGATLSAAAHALLAAGAAAVSGYCLARAI